MEPVRSGPAAEGAGHVMGVLDGKAVVVTGAGRGLGEAFAVDAARAGAKVLANDLDGELAEAVVHRIAAAGGRAVASAQSVRDPDQASAIVERCLAEFGRVDGLVNNAAVHYEALPWEEKVDAARELIEVNVLGALYCGTAALRVMRRQRSGSIVNISSSAAFGQRGAGAYSASKGAITSLTYSWAVDLESLGVRVNGVCPRAWTRIVECSPASQTTCPRDSTPDQIAPLITYLLSDRSAPMTGQMIRFTGDELQLVRQPAGKSPVLRGEGWDVEDIAAAFGGLLDEHLEPYGLEQRQPAALRVLSTESTVWTNKT